MRSGPYRSVLRLARSLWGLAFVVLGSDGLQAAPGSTPFRSPRTEAQLVAETSSIRPGDPVRVGLRFHLAEHWHVYWRNPGDSGTAPSITWELPAGWEAGELEWPFPRRIPVGPFVNFGYEGELVLPVTLRPVGGDAVAAAGPLRVAADAHWLVCREECVPEEARFEMDLTVSEEVPSPSRWTHLFERASERRPVEVPGLRAHVEDRGDDLLLQVTLPPEVDLEYAELEYFPATEAAVEHAAEIGVDRTPDGVRFVLERSPYAAGPVTELDGVLVVRSSGPAVSDPVALVVEAGPPSEVAPEEVATGGELESPGLETALSLAFVGGLLLNLMPCVFPVISIKVLSLLGDREDRLAGVRNGGLFALGVLVSFWVLGGLLVALREAGRAVGWGFQLQSPVFVGLLALLFFVLGLGFLGAFELGSSVVGVATSTAARAGAESTGWGAFWSGALATLIATPCTAPFMGTAVGFASVVEPAVALAVFTALGLGMATPFVALVVFPGALRWLPRPGPWMETLKQVMAFPLFATVLWLLWVLSAQRGVSGVLGVLSALLLAGFGVWLAGRRPGIDSGWRRWITGLGAGSAGLAAIAICVAVPSLGSTEGSGAMPDVESGWIAWSPETVERLRSEGRPVYVDFTARWCLTCQVNKQVVFSSERVLRAFEERDIARVRADWTNQDPRITAALSEYGRSGVPLNIYYPPGRTGAPKVLPTVLSPGLVLEAIGVSAERTVADPPLRSKNET